MTIASIVPAQEVVALLDDTDALRVVLRGHQAVESILNFFLIDLLPSPDVPELQRLRFMLKVDLLVAMGHIPKDDRPPFQKLDQLRNRFAHRADAVLSDGDRDELQSALSEVHRRMLGEFGSDRLDEPIRLVAAVALILHSRIWSSIRRLRDSRIEHEFQAKRLRAAIDTANAKPGAAFIPQSDLDEVVRTSREGRDALGEP